MDVNYTEMDVNYTEMDVIKIKIKSLCDYLLGYYENDVNDNELMFYKYFIDKYGIDFDEFNIDLYTGWKGGYIELYNLLCGLNEDNNTELCKLLVVNVFISKNTNKDEKERINELLKILYEKY